MCVPTRIPEARKHAGSDVGKVGADPAAVTELAPEDLVWTAAGLSSIVASTVSIFGVLGTTVAASVYPMQTLGVAVMLTTIGLLSVMLGAARLPSYLSADTILNTRPRDAAGALVFLFTYLLPIFLIRQAILTVGKPSLFQVLTTSLQAFCIVGGNMSVCLHRYFAHQAFKTTRLMQVAICIAGCCAYQGNPLWWASKHRRHHKHCDGPEDPHSWKQTSYLYPRRNSNPRLNRLHACR